VRNSGGLILTWDISHPKMLIYRQMSNRSNNDVLIMSHCTVGNPLYIFEFIYVESRYYLYVWDVSSEHLVLLESSLSLYESDTAGTVAKESNRTHPNFISQTVHSGAKPMQVAVFLPKLLYSSFTQEETEESIFCHWTKTAARCLSGNSEEQR